MANIKDVAKAAGVSVSTVSNIINDRTFVTEELHQKVIQAMQELDYHPNFLAMNLRKKRINFIGVIVSSLLGHTHQILDGIYRVAKQNKCQPILKIVNSPNEEHREIEALLQMSVSGIIVISSNLNESLIRHYNEVDLPIVFVDHYPINSENNVVRFHNREIVSNLTAELMGQGRRVGLITGNRFLGSEEDCVRGYLEALDSNVQEAPIMLETDFNKERAFAGLFNFVCDLSTVPDCFIVSSSHLAKTVSEICGLLNLENICIYALSGDSWYKHRGDSISYIPRDAIYCGIQATKLLFENIEQAVAFDTQQITIDTRGSTGEVFEEQPQICQFDTKEQKTLKLLLLKSNISNAIEKLSKDFTANTGIRVQVTAASQQELARIVQDNTRSRSSEYDIVMADMHWLQELKEQHAFCKLNDLIHMNDILPRYVRDVRNYILSEAEGDDIFALPILAGYQMLAYRSDLFEDALLKKKFYLKYGVELRPPRTWNEYNLVAKFFTRSVNEESPVRFGTCLTGSNPEGIMAEFLPRQWSYHGHFIGKNGLSLQSVANLKAVKNLCECYQYSYPDCRDYLEDEQIQEFSKGDIAMISTYNVHLQDKLDFFNQNISFARLPGSSALIGGWLLGINAYSKNIDESVRFLQWEMSDRISVHSSLLGQISPFKSVFFDNELLTIYPWMSIVNEQSITLRGKEFGTLGYQGNSVGRQFERMLSDHLWEAILGQIEPEDVLSNTQTIFSDAFSGGA